MHAAVRLCVTTALLSATIISGTAHAETAYFVGNSITQTMNPRGLSAMASASDITMSNGVHSAWGKDLEYIWNNPNTYDRSEEHFGGYSSALANYSWNFVSIQPYARPTLEGSLGLDTDRITDMIDLTLTGPSSTTKFFILTAYPSVLSGDYQLAWDQPTSSDPDQITVHTRQYFEHLQQNLIDHYGDSVDIAIIPIGEVLYQLDILFKSGQFPGFSGVLEDLYADDIHLNAAFGSWIAANTVYATMLGEDPTGIEKPATFYGAGESDPLTPEQSIQLQEIIWDVVSAYQQPDILTGVKIDVDPFSALNTVRPTSDESIIVAIHNTSVADGDDVDFDATQVQPTSLNFGLGAAQNINGPLATDIDGDGDIDGLFMFQTQDTGILCGDTEVSLAGETYSGDQFTATDSITTTDCEIEGCHP
jgi:hypothetical protein